MIIQPLVTEHYLSSALDQGGEGGVKTLGFQRVTRAVQTTKLTKPGRKRDLAFLVMLHTRLGAHPQRGVHPERVAQLTAEKVSLGWGETQRCRDVDSRVIHISVVTGEMGVERSRSEQRECVRKTPEESHVGSR